MKYDLLLISTYELGRQPFGLASPAAWLRRAGMSVDCLDLSIEKLDESMVKRAAFIGFYLPMHTATRLASTVIPLVRKMNPSAHLCAYGLYAPMNSEFLTKLGITTIIGGEFEEQMLTVVNKLRAQGSLTSQSFVSLVKQQFVVPDRAGLPDLSNYAKLKLPDGTHKLVGYTEASRGCKHQCRHCPVVPVYGGTFRIVQREVVLEDIDRQVAAGAEHITFGDPDFFNGIGHAVAIVQRLHENHPGLSYDVTIKIEHLLKHADSLRTLRDTGCLFVTSAVESVDDHVLRILGKNHTRSDLFRTVELFQELRLCLIPTFVTFTPWLTLKGYEDLLCVLASLGQIDNIAPIQLAIRLLIPSGSLLLDLPEIQCIIGEYDEKTLSYRWTHPDRRVDELQRRIETLVTVETAAGATRKDIFYKAWSSLHEVMQCPVHPLPAVTPGQQRATVPYLTEPWFC